MKFGDVFQYMDAYLDDFKTDNFVVIAATDAHVICTAEFILKPENLVNNHDEVFKIPMRKIPVDDFKKWYPNFLYNIAIAQECVVPATP